MSSKFVGMVMGICEDLVTDVAELVSPHDHADIEAFAAQLCGLQGLDMQELRERTAGLQIPGDFRHFRLYNIAKDNIPWGASYSQYQEQITVDQILVFVYRLLRRADLTPYGRGVWTGTTAYRVTDPGVLELGLMFAPMQ